MDLKDLLNVDKKFVANKKKKKNLGYNYNITQ